MVSFGWAWRAFPQTPLLSIIGTLLFGVLAIPLASTFAVIGLGAALAELPGTPLVRLLFHVVKPCAQVAAIVLYLLAFVVAFCASISFNIILSLMITFLLIYVRVLPRIDTQTSIYLVASMTVIFLLLWGGRIAGWLLAEWRKQRDFGGLWLGTLLPWIDHERLLPLLGPEVMSAMVYIFTFAATVMDTVEDIEHIAILTHSWWLAYKEVAVLVFITVVAFDALRDKVVAALRKVRETSGTHA